MKKLLLHIAMLAALVAAGCTVEDQGGQTGQPLACGDDEVPCALAAVEKAVLQRGEDVSTAAAAMLEEGGSMADALAFIAAQDGVVESDSDSAVLRFRVKGGRDCWVLMPEALPPDIAEAAPAMASRRIVPAAAATQRTAKDQGGARVVGDDPQAKHALVLAPFEYQFKAHDDGRVVADMLENTRGYAGHVTFLENSTEGAGTVGIEQFKGWEQYDVILVTGHGATMCVGSYCVSIVLTGDVYHSLDELAQITDPGVNTVHIVGQPSGKLALSPDFFRYHYGGGLTNTLIFFNTCGSYGAGPADASSLSEALLGPGSAYLGWSDVVHADVAYDASYGFFSELTQAGVTVQSAYDRLGSRAVDSYATKGGTPVDATLLIARPGNGDDLRVREVVTLEAPGGGDELQDGDTVAANGTAGDGIADAVPFQMLVEGIEEGQAEAATVTVTVEGHASAPLSVSTGERVSARTYRVRGEIPYIDVAPSQIVNVRAQVTLPEGGTSEHTVSVVLTAEPAPSNDGTDDDGSDGSDGDQTPEKWTGESSMTLTILQGTDTVTVTTIVNLEQTAFSVGKPTKRLRVTGGTMYWSRSGSISTLLDGDCGYFSGTVEVPVRPDDGEILIDTTTSPPTYVMHGNTHGPTVTVAENCGDYSFTTPADGVWVPPIIAFGQFVASPDGTLIAGSKARDGYQWSWSFQRQAPAK